jgi:hypothetical protein
MNRVECFFMMRPLEPLYFGPPRSFSAGENHYSMSQFPPSPFAFQGLIRSHFLRSVKPPLDLDDWSQQAVTERERLVGPTDAMPPGWQLKGPFPARIETNADPWALHDVFASPWVPTPGFLMGECNQPVFARPIMSSHKGINDLGDEVSLLGRPELGALSSIGGWIGPNNLLYALSGGKNGEWDPHEYGSLYPPFVRQEFQPGVAIDPDTGSSLHGMLYALEALRFSDGSGLLGWFSGSTDERIPVDVFERGVLGAGRKRRVALMDKIGSVHPAWQELLEGRHLPNRVKENDDFWLFSLTPAKMTDVLTPGLKVSLPPALEIVFKGAITKPPITLGGYQMATGQSRSNRPYLPAGSVWLFQLKGADAETRAEVLRMLNDAPALDYDCENRFGFGHTLVGIGPNGKEIE